MENPPVRLLCIRSRSQGPFPMECRDGILKFIDRIEVIFTSSRWIGNCLREQFFDVLRQMLMRE
jgi:hypothetical protein